MWDQLIPVDMAGGRQGQGWLYHNFNVRIPPEAESHPIWRILEDPEQNRQALAAMPQFLGTNYVQRAKPAATVLGYSATPIPGAPRTTAAISRWCCGAPLTLFIPTKAKEYTCVRYVSGAPYPS